ncbi:MAG: YggS family pyridoxal phosphate-dependent enzyme [Pseudomonadota bacterium]
MIGVTEQLRSTRQRIHRAVLSAGRADGSVRLLAVGKRQPVGKVREAAAAGQRDFGENIVAEALEKQAALADDRLIWHFIGTLQSNKTRDVAAAFDWVHTVDRQKLVRRLSAQRPHHAPPLNVCIQINIDAEATKSGAPVTAARELAEAVAEAPRLALRGLMCLPRPRLTAAEQRVPFRRLHRLFDELNAAGFGLDTLSMGMSGDLEAAIAEGSTLVRVGTAIFGPREP